MSDDHFSLREMANVVASNIAEDVGQAIGRVAAWPLIFLFRVLNGFTAAIGSALKSWCYDGKALPFVYDRAAEACYEGSKIVVSIMAFFVGVIIIAMIVGCCAGLQRSESTKPKHD